LVQKEKYNEDKPVEGYYVEKEASESVKTQKSDNFDDKLDTSIDTRKISINPSVAIDKVSDEKNEFYGKAC